MAIGLQVTSIEVREITDTHIKLKRVAEAFVEALYRQREEQRLAPAGVDFAVSARRASGGSWLLPLVLLGAFFLIICLSAISIIGSNANKAFTTVGGAVPAALAEPGEQFRLLAFGADWQLLPRAEVQKVNKLAAAGAQTHNGSLLCLVLVEPATPDVRIEGREEAFAKQQIEQSSLQNKQLEAITALDFQGAKAVRYRFTGVGKQPGALRIDTTVFIARGQIFQLFCLGPVNQTAADGSTFQPFLNAFQLLPAEPAPQQPAEPAPQKPAEPVPQK